MRSSMGVTSKWAGARGAAEEDEFAVAGNAHRGLGNDFADANGLDADVSTSAAGPVAHRFFQIVAAGIDGALNATGSRLL